MTPTEKHRADAARVFLDIVRDAPCEGIDGGACWSATVAGKIIAAALAKAEREGMKRAAEIAAGWPTTECGDDYQFDGERYWDAGNVYDQARLDASQRILSEAGEDE